MQITRTTVGHALLLAISGRLDGYWAADLGTALADAVRDGHHHLRVDLSEVTFLSSAGIGALLKAFKQLRRIDGSLAIVHPSPAVRIVLDMSGLGTLMLEDSGAAAPPVAVTPAARHRVDQGDVVFDVVDLSRAAGLRCEAVGSTAPLATAGVTEADCVSLGGRTPAFALGIGAFGEGFADCRSRFGELLSVAGATACQPADGTNVADYLLSAGPLPGDVQLLSGLACEGGFTRQAHFEAASAAGVVALAPLLEGLADVGGADTMGVVLVGETAGLVGAALRRSPALPVEDADFFAHPGIRARLLFTAERAFRRTTTVVAGVVQRGGGEDVMPGLRPLGAGGLRGHLHAAAFPFRPLRRGAIELRETVTALFEHEPLLGVLHLLCDDRGAGGAGQSEFIRGACWLAPLQGTEG